MPQTIEITPSTPHRGYEREVAPQTGSGLGIGGSHPGIGTGSNTEEERQRGRSLEHTHGVDPKLKEEEALCENVAKALYQLEDIGQCRLSVHVDGGEVVVDGEAPSDRAMTTVTKAIESVVGVSKVTNNLRVS